MAKRTVTRAHLAQRIHQGIGLSRDESADLVTSVIEEITRVLARGEAVKVSRFGSFVLNDKSARMGRNPKSKEEVPIQARRVVTFRASRLLKKRVEDGNSAG